MKSRTPLDTDSYRGRHEGLWPGNSVAETLRMCIHSVRTLHFTLSQQGQGIKSKLLIKPKLLTQPGFTPAHLFSPSPMILPFTYPPGKHPTLPILFEHDALPYLFPTWELK